MEVLESRGLSVLLTTGEQQAAPADAVPHPHAVEAFGRLPQRLGLAAELAAAWGCECEALPNTITQPCPRMMACSTSSRPRRDRVGSVCLFQAHTAALTAAARVSTAAKSVAACLTAAGWVARGE